MPRHGEVVVLDTAAADPQYHERVAGAVSVPRPDRAELAAHVAHVAGPGRPGPHGVAVTSELAWREEGGDVVLEGTVSIRLRRADLRAALAAGADIEVVGRD